MSECRFAVPSYTHLAHGLGVINPQFMLETRKTLGLDMPPCHDEVEIAGRQVFTGADQVLHAETRQFSPEEEYGVGDQLSHTEASYGRGVVVILERSMGRSNRIMLNPAWTTDAKLTQQYRADVYDRDSSRPDDAIWTEVTQDRLTEFIPIPFFMRRVARLAVKAENVALGLAVSSTQ